jgi:threonine dehydrogenase-like Zn-dependent dehydrogenase
VRHLVWLEPGHVDWREAVDPQPTADAAIVRPLAVARCDLDPLMAAYGIFPGPYPVGHELVGELIRVGAGVSRHAVGDRVVVPFQVSCGGCAACCDGRFAACHVYRARAGSAFGFGSAGGGHGGAVADQLFVPAVLRLVAAGRFTPRSIVTTVVPFDQAADVWLEAPSTKLVLERAAAAANGGRR